MDPFIEAIQLMFQTPGVNDQQAGVSAGALTQEPALGGDPGLQELLLSLGSDAPDPALQPNLEVSAEGPAAPMVAEIPSFDAFSPAAGEFTPPPAESAEGPGGMAPDIPQDLSEADLMAALGSAFEPGPDEQMDDLGFMEEMSGPDELPEGGLAEEVLAGRIGAKTPDELDDSERAVLSEALLADGTDPEVVDAVTGQGEAGAVASDSGMGVGELLLTLGAAGFVGGLLGHAMGVGGGRGVLAGVGAASKGLSVWAGQEMAQDQAHAEAAREAMEAAQKRQQEVQDFLLAEDFKANRDAFNAIIQGKVDPNQNPDVAERAASWMGGPVVADPSVPGKSSPMDKIRDLYDRGFDALDAGQADMAQAYFREAAGASAEVGVALPDLDSMPLEAALMAFGESKGFSLNERVRQFAILADRLTTEAGYSKDQLKALAKAQGIDGDKRVKEILKLAAKEVPGPERGQLPG